MARHETVIEKTEAKQTVTKPATTGTLQHAWDTLECKILRIGGGFLKNNDYVCPIAQDWNKICCLLEKEYRATHIQEPELRGLDYWNHIGLPIPLILNGWVFSSDFEKRVRWQETIIWAEKNSLLWVIEKNEFQKYGENS